MFLEIKEKIKTTLVSQTHKEIMMSTKEYIKNFIKDPNIASVTPTSKQGVKEVCSKMSFENRVVIIEYGPATGVFTNYLLEQMSSDSVIITIELNENFVDYLKNNVQDERIHIHHASAERVHDIMEGYGEQADYILSGIPFTLMNNEVRRNIVKQTHSVLKQGGKFLPYQTFFQRDGHLKDHLHEHFSSVQDRYVFRNIPPMRVYEAIK